MSRRSKKKRKPDTSKPNSKDGVLSHSPFKGIKIDVTEPDASPVPTPPPPPPSPKEMTEEELYEAAMNEVVPLSGGIERVHKEIKPKPMLLEMDDDALVMQQLDDLVHGDIPFDFADTDEYIEASVSGLDRRLIRKLKRGEFSFQAHLDLHGFNRTQARDEVARFIFRCRRENKRCVLIVHGRGMGSKDNIPVLKIKLASWLTRGAIGRRVLAFTSARPNDGGTGAVYVLLKS